MTWTAKLKGGEKDGLEASVVLDSLPELIDSSNPNTFMYVGKGWYILRVLDFESETAWYEPVVLQYFEDEAVVENKDGGYDIVQIPASTGSPEDGLKDEGGI